MKEVFKKYGIDLSNIQLEKFEKYKNLLKEYNEKFNITAITDDKEIILKHFVDSCIGLKLICGKNLIDIGSGGGFPAIPIKILKDDLSLTLVESIGKKANFLEIVVKELELKNVKILNSRAEDIAKDELYREKFEVCTARAVARLNTLSEYCLPFVKIGGNFISYKGIADEEIIEAESAVKILGGRISQIEKYRLEKAQRALICIEKISKTDKKYPRGNGKERKNPL